MVFKKCKTKVCVKKAVTFDNYCEDCKKSIERFRKSYKELEEEEKEEDEYNDFSLAEENEDD